MKTEKVILSFIAVLIGLLVAGIAFYFYESSRSISPSQVKSISPAPSPVKPQLFLTLDQPTDEQVFDKKTIIVSGKTMPSATVVIVTTLGEQVVTPASNGAFSTTVTIDDGQNILDILAVDPNGEEARTTKTVSFSTESF